MPGGEFSSPRSIHEPVPAKKLPAEELKASADRLSTQHRKEVDLPPLVEKRVLSDDQMKHSLERLYTQTVERKKKMLEELDKKAHPDLAKHVQLDQDVLQNAFTRLHDGSMNQKKENMNKLKKKYMHQGGDKKTLNKEELVASAQRLCNGSMDSAKESHTKLFEKYVVATAPKFPKMTAEQLKTSADRLCAKKQ